MILLIILQYKYHIMFSFLKKLFGGSSVDLAALMQEGAVVIDVRTPAEFNSGHVKDSINIPLDKIASKADSLKKHKHIIVCCRSGARSSQAKNILNSKGFSNVYNGGSWQSVKSRI